MEHWTVDYTGTQSLITTLSYLLAENLGYFYRIVIDWFQTSCAQTCISDFVFHHWGCVSIYKP